MLIDENGYLPASNERTNLFFQLLAKRYEKRLTLGSSNKNFGKLVVIFKYNTISAAILDRILHHVNMVKIIGDSYSLKERSNYITIKNN